MNKSQEMCGLEILVAKVLVNRILFNFRADDYRKTVSRLSENEVMPHPGVRVNSQGRRPSAAAITTKENIKLSFVATPF
jgi:hypothetical protein